MSDVTNLADTVVPKSDQLNADDMLTGPITVTVMDVKRGSQDQPVWIVIDGGRQPYKPCKSMRRLLIAAWGANGKEWIGRSMQLYCDPNVKFGGVALGGIRISHMTHIDKTLNVMLTQSRGRKAQYTVHPLHVERNHQDQGGSIGRQQIDELQNAISAKGFTVPAACQLWSIQSLSDIPAQNFQSVMHAVASWQPAQQGQ